MSEFNFVDVSAQSPRKQHHWPSVIVPRAAIDAEVERLASMPQPESGRRATSISHPANTGPAPALAPGIDATIEVLKPGEESLPIARNSSMVDMCIRGEGVAMIGADTHGVGRFDVWNTPSMAPYRYRNNGNDLFVRLSFSNAPLLERLEVHYIDRKPKLVEEMKGAKDATKPRARDLAEGIDLGADGARLLGYEYLIDIDTVEWKPLLWRWRDVEPHLDKVFKRDLRYTGRHLYLLYNPATERRMGTSPCFFATIAKYPANKMDIAHRHVSAAINYYFMGHGKSAVMGKKFEWEAGDLHLSAPGWAVHHHGSREQGFCALTIQDHPLHIAMDSLLWQENLQAPILKLGSDYGFQTNLTELEPA